jgi:glucose-fructose oxidoreductase
MTQSPTTDRDGKVRYAVVGIGHITQAAVLPAFQNTENCELVALVSGDAEKLAKVGDKYGVEHRVTYDDYADFLDRGLVDAAYIAVPNHLHCDYTVETARSGVHVLCEKPMAVTVDECRRMIEVCDDNGVKLMIAYRLHFEAGNLEAIEIAQRGELGSLRFFDATFTQDVKEPDIRLGSIEKGGGTVYDMGIYCINAMRFLFQAEPFEVTAWSASSEDSRFSQCDEMTSAILRFPGHRLGSFTTSFGAAQTDSFRLVGTRGELEMEPAFGYATHIAYELNVDGGSRARRFPKRDQFGPELIYFSDCILNDEPPEPNGHEGMADVQIIQAIYKAAETGEPVQIEGVEEQLRPGKHQEITRPGFEKPEEIKASSPKEK